MAHKKIREYDSKRMLNEHFKRLSGCELPIKFAQITESTNLNDLANNEPWLSSSKLVVKPDMLFGKRGKSSFALNLDYTQVATFVKEQLGKEHQMEGERGTQIQTQSATSGSSAAEAIHEENIMEQFLGTRRGHKTDWSGSHTPQKVYREDASSSGSHLARSSTTRLEEYLQHSYQQNLQMYESTRMMQDFITQMRPNITFSAVAPHVPYVRLGHPPPNPFDDNGNDSSDAVNLGD